ncbi:HNH endonuclease signature motif containing protein [Flavobacterium sp.]|uniref:HNH endonuclease n=1 Tax=Flavobacterium sp. TaxID=239 RepID=UPI003267527F
MSKNKKLVRERFRDLTFKRDKYCCVMCGFKSTPENAIDELDSHHLINREAMPSGGYVPENGISLCSDCHIKAEEFYSTGTAHPGYSVEELFEKIGSSEEKAREAAKKL